MPRILFFVFLAFLFWFLIRVLGGARKPRGRVDAAPEAARVARPLEPMSQCAWCGAHIAADATLALPDGRRYCCVEHRAAASGAADR